MIFNKKVDLEKTYFHVAECLIVIAHVIIIMILILTI